MADDAKVASTGDLIADAHAYQADTTVRGSGCDDESNGGGKPIKWSILGGDSYPITQGWGYTAFARGEGAPMYGYSLKYGWKELAHPAIDIGCPDNTPVYAANDGVVEFAGPDQYYNPNHVNVRADSGALEIYGHLLQVSVEVGQKVKRGDPLGLSGHQFNPLSGAHLHFEVLVPDSTTEQGQLTVNPCEYLGGVSFSPNGSPSSSGSGFSIWGGVTDAIKDVAIRGFVLMLGVVLLGIGLWGMMKE